MARHRQVHSLGKVVVDKVVDKEEVREEVPSPDPTLGARAIDLAELLTCDLLHFGVPDIYS